MSCDGRCPGSPLAACPGRNARVSDDLHRKIRPQGRCSSSSASSSPKRFPALSVTPDQFWTGLSGLVARFAPRNRELLAFRDELQMKIDGWHREHGAGRERSRRLRGLPPRDRLSRPRARRLHDRDREPRSRDHRHLRSAARRSGQQRALRAQRRQRPLGQPLRCALRHRRDPAHRRPRAGQGPQRRRAPRPWSPAPPISSTRPFRWPRAAIAMSRRTRSSTMPAVASLVIDTKGGPTTLKDRDQFVGYREEDAEADVLLRPQRPPRHPRHRQQQPGRQDAPRGSRRRHRRSRDHHHPGLRGFRRRGRCRGQGAGLSQLARADDRHARGHLREGRPDRPPQAQRGPRLPRHAARPEADPQGPGAAARAQCRPPDDDARGARCRGQRDRRGPARCRGDRRSAPCTAAPTRTTGAIYIVKPKMHGPDEVAFACDVFGAVEAMLGLKPETIKIGIMDEERRTSANLKACIYAARRRVFFINTGFLDRTGDEIHTSMEAGPVLPKAEVRSERWIASYEDRNVLIGLAAGFSGKAQIGKGMWARPDDMAEMMKTKAAPSQRGRQHRLGAVADRRDAPRAALSRGRRVRGAEAPPQPADPAARAISSRCRCCRRASSMPRAIARELDNNAQSILGYVVRWIDQGVGCSKVPDINNVGLMEDRATLPHLVAGHRQLAAPRPPHQGAGRDRVRADGRGGRQAERGRSALPADGRQHALDRLPRRARPGAARARTSPRATPSRCSMRRGCR